MLLAKAHNLGMEVEEALEKLELRQGMKEGRDLWMNLSMAQKMFEALEKVDEILD